MKSLSKIFLSFSFPSVQIFPMFLSLPEKTILQYGFDKFYYYLDQEMGCACMLIHAKCVCRLGMQAWM